MKYYHNKVKNIIFPGIFPLSPVVLDFGELMGTDISTTACTAIRSDM